MAENFKLVGKVGPFEIYKSPRRVAIYEGEAFFVQLLRNGNAADYRDPEAYCRDVLESRAEYEADKAAQRGAFRKALAAARAERAAKIARQGAFAW